LAGHAGIETIERFYIAVRKDVLDRARTASEASRKGQSVARLLGLSIYLERSLHSLWCLFIISLRIVSMGIDKEIYHGILVESSD
jgi:hypothetical protein